MKISKLNLMVLGTVVGGAAAVAAYALFVRPWHLRWGATDEELEMPLPGDVLVEHPKLNATHAITINAPVADVWPWLVQVGKGEADFTATRGSKILSAARCKMPTTSFRSGST